MKQKFFRRKIKVKSAKDVYSLCPRTFLEVKILSVEIFSLVKRSYERDEIPANIAFGYRFDGIPFRGETKAAVKKRFVTTDRS